MSEETIVAAAIRVPSHRMAGAPPIPPQVIVTSPPPARHHTLLLAAQSVGPYDQGFLTSTGRFVGREEALLVAMASGQPMIDHPSRHALWLFSEDLW